MTRRLIPALSVPLVVVGGLAAGWQAARPPAAEPTAPAPPPAPARFKMADSTPVVGVSAGGRHRAYPLAELMDPRRHVFNDTLGPIPVTVTFCDLSRCVRVFTADRRDGLPLDLRGGGPNPRKARSMLVTVGTSKYEQETGEPLSGGTELIPYPTLPHVMTTWGEWRAAHPDTELLVDGEPVPAAGM